MEKIPQNLKNKEEKNEKYNTENLIQNSEIFSSWRDKLKFGVLSFYESQGLLKKFLSDDEKIDFYEENDLVSLIEEYYANDLAIEIEDENGVESEEPHIFGVINFDKGNFIHFNESKKGSRIEKKISLEESFSLLADFLAEQDVLPSKIKAQSWLMDTIIREKIGFEKVSEVPGFSQSNLSLSPSLWGQLIDESGNLKKKELEFLFKNMHPRYKEVLASIDIESFMRRFGEKHLGKEFTILDSTLKEQTQKDLDEVSDYFRKHFEKEGYEKFYNFIQDKPLWFEFSQTTKGKRFFEILNFFSEKIRKESVSLEDLVSIDSEETRELRDIRINAYEPFKDNFLENIKGETYTKVIN